MADVVQESRKFRHYGGENLSGHWVREAICCDPATRKYTNVARDKDGNLVEFEEIVYTHHGYHPFIDGEKKPRRAFFFRGAKVWRD